MKQPKRMAVKKHKKRTPKRTPADAPTVATTAVTPITDEQERRERQKREDFDLVTRATKGDQKAYEELVNRYKGQLHNLMYRMVHSMQEAEDLVQEAFMKAFGSLANFNYEYAFSTWLYKIATNNCIDHLRKKKLQTFSIDAPIEYKDSTYTMEIPDLTYYPDKEMIRNERNSLIKVAIDSLPEKYKTVIYLRHSDELSYEEIASMLNIPIGTVKARIFRAREMLNRFLKGKVDRN